MKDTSWSIDQGEAGARLDKFLAHASRLGSRSNAAQALERGKVFVNDAEVGLGDAARRLAAGDSVRVWQDRPGSSRSRTRRAARPGELSIVHEDDALIVVDKPPGLLSVRLERKEDETSVEEELVAYFRSKGKRRPWVVHRIDRDTSGLVAFAKRPDAYAHLRGQFRRHEPERIYLAVVHGHPSPRRGRWSDTLVWDDRALIQKETHPHDPDGRPATCDYEVMEELDGAALLRVQLVTGRRNQIRLQARLHGHTLVGEQRYIQRFEGFRPIPFKRQALHAHRLVVLHPDSRQRSSFESPLPLDMRTLIEQLRG